MNPPSMTRCRQCPLRRVRAKECASGKNGVKNARYSKQPSLEAELQGSLPRRYALRRGA